MTPTSPAAKPAANSFAHMEDLVAIGLLDQGTLDAAKAKAGISKPKTKDDNTVEGPYGLRLHMAPPLHTGKTDIKPGKINTPGPYSAQALALLKKGRIPGEYKPKGAPKMRPDPKTEEGKAVLAKRAQAQTTRVGGKPQATKPAVPQPLIFTFSR